MANLKAVLTKPKVSESHQRNAFDRSEVVNMSYSTGGLDVVFKRQFTAGSHVKLNRRIFQRTAAVNTAAFPTIDTHVEFFYVPLRLLDSYWGNFKTNIQDYNSTHMGSYSNTTTGDFTPYVTTNVPQFDLAQLGNNLKGYYMNASGLDVYGFGGYTANQKKEFAINAARLLDGLGYGYLDPAIGMYSTNFTQNFTVNPYMLAAYQKVYYDHFRNTAYESNNPIAYNLDRLHSQGGTPILNYNEVQMNHLLQYRYVNYRKDYFQALYPALNYVQSSPSGLSWTIPDTFVNAQVGANSSNIMGVLNNVNSVADNIGFAHVVTSSTSSSQLSIQTIRAGFALDKLLRVSAYTPKHVKDQFEARFGIKGVESDMESIRIGAFMNNIIIREVLQTSKDTSSGTSTSDGLGEYGGIGVGSDDFGKDIEWTCKEDCIILGLIYSMPRSSYDSYRIDNWNAKISREEFFHPEFMNSGLQPLYNYEQDAIELNSGASNYGQLKLSAQLNGMYGYVDRYQEYKCGIDTNRGYFNYNQPLGNFINHTNYVRNQVGNGVGMDYFKVQPYDMDDIFVQSYSPTSYFADHYITNICIKCISNQNMSVHGQPSI